MAGIGVVLDRFVKRPTLTAFAGQYGYSIFVVAGPWLCMVVAIGAIGYMACPAGHCDALLTFRSVIIYNFLFSIVLAAPIALPLTRFMADEILAGDVSRVPGAFFQALLIFAVAGGAIVGPFYVLVPALSWPEKIAALQNFALTGAAWLLVPFLGVTKDFRAISASFFTGGGAMAAAAWLAPHSTPLALMNAFNLGLAVLNCGLLWRFTYVFGARVVFDKGIGGAFARHWELAAIALFNYMGLWAGNIVMWIAAPAGVIRVAGAFQTMPDYDSVMFWAQLTAIPALALFYVHVEENLSRIHRAFQLSFERRASRREIEERLSALSTFVMRSVGGLFFATIVILSAALLASYWGIEHLGLRASQMGMFRAGLFGVAFHTSAMFCLMFMLHFDLRRSAIAVTLAYFVLNALLTSALLPLKFPYYGYGTMLAAAISFGLAVALLVRELPWLSYHAFVTNNVSLKGK